MESGPAKEALLVPRSGGKEELDAPNVSFGVPRGGAAGGCGGGGCSRVCVGRSVVGSDSCRELIVRICRVGVAGVFFGVLAQ
jgi:hypothetical protein